MLVAKEELLSQPGKARHNADAESIDKPSDDCPDIFKRLPASQDVDEPDGCNQSNDNYREKDVILAPIKDVLFCGINVFF
jgi:hypothetical protein